jgi:hypothetical protein
MKPAWDSLAQKFANSDKVVIADVDCTAAGKDLCERFNVEGFPTIKYFNPPDEEGEDYDGGRDEDSLVEFANTLGPGCSASTIENCSEEQKAELEKIMKQPAEELEAQLAALKEAMTDKEKAHEKLVEGLQAQYEESQKSVDAFKKETAPKIKMLRAALPVKPKDGAGKDEM